MTVTEMGVERTRVERLGAVARIVINRPPLNILDIGTIRDLDHKLNATLSDASVRLVEIRGAGDQAFSAGTDIHDHFPKGAPDMLREFHGLIRSLFNAKSPTIAVVRGHCLGGGMELAMACDFIVACVDARFGQPEINVGCFPPVAVVLLPRLIPERKALELILTGEPIDSREAYRLGLVSRLADGASLDREVEELEKALLSQSPTILALARKAVGLGSRQGFESALRESERIYLEELLKIPDATEGLNAFLQKRPPAWGGGGLGASKP